MPRKQTKEKSKPKSKPKQIQQDREVKDRTILKDIKANFPEILKQTMGLITLACEKSGINRSTYYEWRNDPEFAAACDEVPARVGDLVESALYNKIQKGDGESIRFYCKTKLKNRGYTTALELLGANGGPLNMTVHHEAKRLNRLSSEQLERYIEIQQILGSDEPLDTGG